MDYRFSSKAYAPIVLTVPGLRNSGPAHWQTLWETLREDTLRIDLGDWNLPHRNSWVNRIDEAVRALGGPIVFAAHSLGCHAVAWWAKLAGQPFGWPVAGALLVAPVDMDQECIKGPTRGFAPAPADTLPFPSIVVASRDDPWASIESAHDMAANWGSTFVDAGERGHLNAESGLGFWAEGQALLDRLIDLVPDGGNAPLPRTPAPDRRTLPGRLTRPEDRPPL